MRFGIRGCARRACARSVSSRLSTLSQTNGPSCAFYARLNENGSRLPVLREAVPVKSRLCRMLTALLWILLCVRPGHGQVSASILLFYIQVSLIFRELFRQKNANWADV